NGPEIAPAAVKRPNRMPMTISASIACASMRLPTPASSYATVTRSGVGISIRWSSIALDVRYPRVTMVSNSRPMISADPEQTWSAARAPLWDELAALVGRAGRDQRALQVDEVGLLARRYQQAAADLARLRAEQPGSPVLPGLNDLVARAHAVLYRPSRAPLRAIGRFLWVGYPRAVWEMRRLVLAAAVFQIVVAVGGFVWA